MDVQNEEDNVFNFKLAKLTGLYQMIDPGAVRFRGRNVYHIVIACVLLGMCLVAIMLNLSGLYNCTVNVPISMDFFWKSENTFYLVYKFWIVVRHSDDIWRCLSITRYGFTSSGDRSRHILDRWRERLTWLTTIYAVVCFAGTITNVATTLPFSHDKSPVKNRDGSIGHYRQNVMNFYFVVSDETYNAYYYTFYSVEALFIFLLAILFIVFDILLITLCFGISCQMQVVCSAFETIGHRSRSPADNRAESTKIQLSEHSLIYDELKKTIVDHQAVMRKYEDFLNLFRRVMLIQIFVSSLSVVALLFTFIMGFSDDDRFMASNGILKITYCSIPPILFQMFVVCYLFGNIHDQVI